MNVRRIAKTLLRGLITKKILIKITKEEERKLINFLLNLVALEGA